MPEIKALFWDNGGVILTNGWDRNSRRAAVEKFHLDGTDFKTATNSCWMLLKLAGPRLTSIFSALFFIANIRSRPLISKAFVFEQSQPFQEPLEFLGQLAKTRRYFLAALNNESREINEYRIEKFRLLDYFEAFFSSCYLGMRKPGAGIYSLALQITQRKPAECVFIDDRGLNLECARELGMHTILFKNLPQLRDELAHFNIVPDGK